MRALLLVREDREYLCRPGEELQTDLGVLRIPEDPEPGDVVESHLGEAFRVRRLRGPDLFNHFERTGAPMMPRDAGLVMGHLGLETGDRVLDAGTGTGVLAAYLGRIDAEVITYERKAEFADVARENMRLAGLEETVEVRTGDLLDELGGLSGFDAMTLDTEDAAAAVRAAPDVLIPGGVVAVYAPFVEQSREAAEAACSVGLADVETVETIQRHMDFDERGSRPSTAGVGHTGFLTFGRLE